jgi:2-dehydropantoate 2-reductase
MKVCVVGAGGIGGYFGARLIHAGFDVSLVARGQHAECLKSKGLKLISIEGDLELPVVQVIEKPVDGGPYDLVLVCVKAWQVPEVASQLNGALSDSGVVVPLQNGVDAARELSDVLGETSVLSGLCGLVSFIKAPGVIQHAGLAPFIKIGEVTGPPSPRVLELVSRLEAAEGMSVSAPADMRVALWQKFLFIVAMSGVGSVTQAPLGITRENEDTRSMLKQCVTEAYQVGRALDVPLPESSVQAIMDQIDAAPAAATASMQRDIAAGICSELFAQNGAVVRMGKECGIATPVNSFITSSLELMERRARGEIAF